MTARKAAPKKKVKAKSPSKKRVSKTTSVKTKKSSKKSSPKKRASSVSSKKKPKKKPVSELPTLHKDGSEKGHTTDILFASIRNYRGRPPAYTIAIAKKICLLISMGYSLTKITEYEDMPAMPTVCRWLDEKSKYKDFREWYSCARTYQIDIVEDRVMDICMYVDKVPIFNSEGDMVYVDGERLMVNHPANVQLAKLQTDSHYKYLGALRAKKWGNATDADNTGDTLLQMMGLGAGRLAALEDRRNGKEEDLKTFEIVDGEVVEVGK